MNTGDSDWNWMLYIYISKLNCNRKEVRMFFVEQLMETVDFMSSKEHLIAHKWPMNKDSPHTLPFINKLRIDE